MLQIFQRVIAVLYAYGAVVHVVNLAGFGPDAPPDRVALFRALDVVFLVVDLIVVIGLWRNRWWGLAAFFLAAISQVVMYAFFTDSFAADEAQARQLMGLVAFHLVTMVVMTLLLVLDRRRNGGVSSA